MAAAGLTPKEAQDAMGHADIRTTLNIYAKALPGGQQAAAKLDAYPGGDKVALATPSVGRLTSEGCEPTTNYIGALSGTRP
jgi:hypothetical protein